MIRIGELLKKVRDEELYKYFGCDTFAEFYGTPELGFKQSTVYTFIEIYETFVLQLGMSPEQVSQYEPSKLQCIKSRVRKNPEEAGSWLIKASELSRADLKRELGFSEKSIGNTAPPQDVIPEIENETSDYDEWVRSQMCCVCGRESTLAHWPRTRVRGEFSIPLCISCHREQEDAVKAEWFGNNFRSIGEFLDKVRGTWRHEV